MKTRNLTAKALVIAVTAAGFASHAVRAQNMWAANAAFDQQFNQRLAAMQQQNANAQQQLWQRHLQVNGPRLSLMASQVSDAFNTKTRVNPDAVWNASFLPSKAELDVLPKK